MKRTKELSNWVLEWNSDRPNTIWAIPVHANPCGYLATSAIDYGFETAATARIAWDTVPPQFVREATRRFFDELEDELLRKV